jgi:hypothetical protein
MMVHSSPTGRTRRFSMSQVERMLKDKPQLSTRNTEEPTRDGRLCILTKIRETKPRDLTRTSVSIAINHSTSSQDSQCTESPNLTELTTLLSTDTSREETTNNGSSTVLTRPSDPTTGRTTPLKFNRTVDHPTSELLQLSTQDGGKCSELKVLTLSMRKERSSMSQEELMMKTETSLSTTNMENSTNNGTLFTLINGQKNQRMENSTKTSVSVLEENSTSKLLCHQEDILI